MLGIDVDWEYPASEREGHDFVELLRETRKVRCNQPIILPRSTKMFKKALDAYTAKHQSAHMLLTIACPAGLYHATSPQAFN